MLSKFVARGLRMTPILANRAMMVNVPQRCFVDRLGFDAVQSHELTVDTKGGEVSLW